MKILLVKPPKNKKVLTFSRTEPLELEYLASAVKEHEVKILDMRIDRDLMKRLEQFRPDFVGTTAYTCDVNMAKDVLKEVKKFDKNVQTGVGGYHATSLPYDFAEPYVDIIFLGMSDFSFRNYIRTLNRDGNVLEVENIALVKENKLYFSEKKDFDGDLDSLPFPARDLTLPYRNKYHDQMRNKTADILTSRGCPYRCAFCACWKFMNGKYITRSPESVVEEIAMLPDEVDLVSFADDNTLHDIKRAWRLAELLKEGKPQKNFSMYARTDTIVRHPDLIESLRDAGLTSLTVGLESYQDEILDAYNKKTSVKTNNEAIKVLQNLGVSISAHFIINPEYTQEDFERLLKYVYDNNLFRLAFPVLTPFPGTDLYLIHRDRFVIKDYDFYDATHSILPTKLKRNEFYRLLADLYRKSYSFRRYFNSKFKESYSLFNKSKGDRTKNADRISLFKLGLVHICALPMYIKIRNNHKSESSV